MSGNSSKVMLAVGVTALVTAIVLITAFVGYLYLQTDRVSGPAPPTTAGGSGSASPGSTAMRRPRGSGPAASEITRIKFFESSMASTTSKPAALLSNINVQNFTSSSRTVTFASDGTATREIVTEKTVNGVKSGKTERSIASIGPEKFAALAEIFADNDFVNEPDSKDITSLPIKKFLTVTYASGEKTINTAHMDRNTLEVAAMLNAFRQLEKQTAWTPAL